MALTLPATIFTSHQCCVVPVSQCIGIEFVELLSLRMIKYIFIVCNIAGKVSLMKEEEFFADLKGECHEIFDLNFFS